MLSEISYRDLHISQSAPDISVYAAHCISREGTQKGV